MGRGWAVDADVSECSAVGEVRSTSYTQRRDAEDAEAAEKTRSRNSRAVAGEDPVMHCPVLTAHQEKGPELALQAFVLLQASGELSVAQFATLQFGEL